jgi:hypothetical protein
MQRERDRMATSREANGESSGSDSQKRTFQGQTDWDQWRYTRIAIPLATGARTLKRATLE